MLALGADGSVTYKNYGIAAAASVSLRIDDKVLTVDLPENHTGTQVSITVPEGWSVGSSAEGVTVVSTKQTEHQLTVPAGVTEARLVKR
ncbi:MAG: hypothetical protein K8U03_22690 [Planctomycetia bacterium]|nr:hypothetical protein [Planctomycetia bacterium]